MVWFLLDCSDQASGERISFVRGATASLVLPVHRVGKLLTFVSGPVFTHAIEQTFENGSERARPEVGDGSGACPEEGSG